VTDGVARGSNDPAYVERQYATEAGLAARKRAYRFTEGPDARDVVFHAVAASEPRRVLEVGCGEGELAARIGDELDAQVVAVDQSSRMVELSRERGVDTEVGDVQALRFPDGEFDVVVAAWMLYHVPELDAALSEIARVLAPGGALVAATNGSDHLAELLALSGIERWDLPFCGENGADLLRHHFPSVETTHVDGNVTFADMDAVREYYASSERLAAFLDRLPTSLPAPLVARRRPVVFVAEKAA
jgi:SAM-dependent methyltransferase